MLSMFTACWGVGYSPSFANVLGFRGKAFFPFLPSGYATGEKSVSCNVILLDCALHSCFPAGGVFVRVGHCDFACVVCKRGLTTCITKVSSSNYFNAGFKNVAPTDYAIKYSYIFSKFLLRVYNLDTVVILFYRIWLFLLGKSCFN